MQQHLRVRTFQLKVVSIDTDGFGDARAGPCQEQQKRAVAPTTGRPLIGRRNDGVHFCGGGGGASPQCAPVLWESSARVARHQRTPGRPLPHGGRKIVSQLVGHCAWRRCCSASPPVRRERRERSLDRDLRAPTPPASSQPGGGKEGQHAQGVAIARDSRVALLGQAPAKVGFQERRQEQMFARAAPPSRKARSAAMARRSAEPVR